VSENQFQRVSAERVIAAVRAYGPQKRLALDLDLSDVELTRLVNDHLPKLCALMAQLGLEVVDQGHVADLRKVLKAVL
jgi:hypothetical protein